MGLESGFRKLAFFIAILCAGLFFCFISSQIDSWFDLIAVTFICLIVGILSWFLCKILFTFILKIKKIL